MKNIRVGIGYDVHRLEDDHPFFLGGVKIPYHRGALGHSDADTLIHAIIDALLGAAGLGDIGQHFPDSDETLKGIDSKVLLNITMDLIENEDFLIGNVDCTICLEKPKIATYIPAMQTTLSEVMGVDKSQISIKATTTEGLGLAGREEGLSVYAVALLYKE